jgi:hypothetical protein
MLLPPPRQLVAQLPVPQRIAPVQRLALHELQ